MSSFVESRTRAARQGFGRPVLRREDPRLLTGAGCYSDDVNRSGQAYAALVRSPHAHAAIRGIDVTAAIAMPGVIAVLTTSPSLPCARGPCSVTRHRRRRTAAPGVPR